jgi:hypothetical protein
MARTRRENLKFSSIINIIKNIDNEKIIIIFFTMISIFFVRISYLYDVSYHNFPHSIIMEIITRFLKSFILTLPVIFSAAFFDIRITRFAACFSLIYALYLLFRVYLPIDWLGNYDLIVLIIPAALLSVASLLHLSDRAWHRSSRIILATILAWGLSPLLLAWIQSDQAMYRTFTIDRVVQNPPKAVVVLILDEMSPELAPLLRAVLTTDDHILHVGQVKRAGKNTINAIPSMLTPQLHDNVAVCSATSLCGSVFFDMARLRTSVPGTDVVGFYHPYCAILGLRSCWIPMPPPANFAGYFNEVTAKFHLATGGVFPKLKQPVAAWTEESTRDAIAQHALNAPFWTEGGGFLYVHQSLPHPKTVTTELGLRDEYNTNMREASEFVNLIKNKLQRRFGKEYLLIVTSDHPLRTSMWCRKPAYKSTSCVKENFVETSNVPFVVSAPQNVPVNIPMTNVGLFSPAP